MRKTILILGFLLAAGVPAHAADPIIDAPQPAEQPQPTQQPQPDPAPIKKPKKRRPPSHDDYRPPVHSVPQPVVRENPIRADFQRWQVGVANPMLRLQGEIDTRTRGWERLPSMQAQAQVYQTIASECRALEVIVTGFRAQTPQVDYLNRLATQVIEEHRRAFQSYPDLVSSGRANQANWNRQLQVNRTRMGRAKVAYDGYYNQVVGMAR